MNKYRSGLCWYRVFVLLTFFALVFSPFSWAEAEVNINFIAVNATDTAKETPLEYYLPPELSKDDILDTGDFKLDYDVNAKAFYIHGSLMLNSKESKTLTVKVRDVWKIQQQEVDDIKKQIEDSVARMETTDYYESSKVLRKNLEDKLDYIMAQQGQYSNSVERRIDQYRMYAGLVKDIRAKAVSINFWKSKPEEIAEKTIKFIIEVENPSATETKVLQEQHYLPAEIKPEHVVEPQGFEIRFDIAKGQSFLFKEEEFKPAEKKRYEIGIKDIWNISDPSMQDLQQRTDTAFAELENTVYVESAHYLVQNIETNLQVIKNSQSQEKTIKEHIGAYRKNQKHFQQAEADVKALEELVSEFKKDREISRMKNVLRKVRTLSGVAAIADAIFGTKPSPNSAWKFILGIILFVGLYTLLHFLLWGKRSKEHKIKRQEEQEQEKGQESQPVGKK